MPYASPPQTLTLGQASTVAPPPNGIRSSAVVLTNASPYHCAVSIGGPQQWLPAWTADLYQVPVGATVTVTPSLVISGASTDATLLAAWQLPTDPPAGAYPQALTSQAIAAAIAGSVAVVNAANTQLLTAGDQFLIYSGAITVGPDTGLSPQIVVSLLQSPTIRSVLVVLQQTGTSGVGTVPSFVTMGLGAVGNRTGVAWATNLSWPTPYPVPTAAAETIGPLVFPAYATADTSLQVTFAFAALTGAFGAHSFINYTVQVIGLPDEYLNTPALPTYNVAAVVNADKAVSVTVAAGGSVLFTPTPPAGFVHRIGTLTIRNLNTNQIYSLVGATTAGTYVQVGSLTVASTQTEPNSLIVPLDLYVSESINASVSAGGSVQFTGYYRLVPVV